MTNAMASPQASIAAKNGRQPRGARRTAALALWGASFSGAGPSAAAAAAAFVVQPAQPACSRRRRAQQSVSPVHVPVRPDSHPGHSLGSIRHPRLATWLHSSSGNGDGAAQTQSSADNNTRRIDNVRRIFAISDLHTDSEGNMEWLVERCSGTTSIPNDDGDDAASRPTPGPNDALIIAGDISHDLDVIRQTLSTIVTNLQCHTFFIPGNHEAWIGGDKMDGIGLTDSFSKLDRVVQVCDELGVHTTAKLVGCLGLADDAAHGRHPVWIVPLWSWYDGSLALPGCEDLSDGLASWPWVDFRRCEWGEEYAGTRMVEVDGGGADDARFAVPGCERVPSKRLTELFLSWNEPSLEAVKDSPVGDVITFSHFLPSQQTLPDWKVPSSDTFRRDDWLDHPVPDVSAKFAYVAGSELIDEQIRSIDLGTSESGPTTRRELIHVFGHSHRPKDFSRNGIRYIHNPVGKPVEREMNMIDGQFDFQLIWDCWEGEIEAQNTITRYWEQYGGGVELLAENMAKRKRKRRQKAASQKE